MKRIQILPEDLANQIAAGEVVERPASVVKELIENSVDAKSTRIRVDIELGGKKLIKVTDNGVGMSQEDARLAFSRHATSKISRSQDLESIRTLGFRGEALPSISSIAKVRMTTANDEYRGGTLVVIESGEIKSVKDVAFPRGTTIDVEQIFFNTPARKKFLKGDGTEFSHIAQVVTQQALAFSHIHFTLNHNGREVINTLPTEQPVYRVAEIFGAELARELVEVKESTVDYQLEGYVSSPIYTRSNRSAQYCFINQRFVRDKVILHATQQGYSHLLPRGQHPVLFLMLTMDSRLLDVNVHPSKAEVRFAFQQDVHRLVSQGVRNALIRNEKSPMEEGKTVSVPVSENLAVEGGSQSVPEKTSASGRSNNTEFAAVPRPSTVTSHRDFGRAMEMMCKGQSDIPYPGSSEVLQQIMRFDRSPAPVSKLIYSEFEPLGQLDNSFIVLQGKSGMVIVDQHVAHERILYERFRDAAKNRKIEVQRLLFPLALGFAPAEAELLSAHLEKLGNLGVELEPFGANEFLLRAVPAVLKHNDHEEILRDIVEKLPRQNDPRIIQEKFEDILIMMSCRNAIKVNHPLDMDQIKKLLSDLEQTEMPFTCPHGRPISLFFDIEDILKKFLRK